jgi:hypothetical protein
MKNNIDKLAQDKLYHYQASPPDDAWLFIKANIKQKKNSFIPPFLWKGMAATIALLISFGTGYFVSFKQSSKLFIQTNNEIAQQLFSKSDAEIKLTNELEKNRKAFQSDRDLVSHAKSSSIRNKTSVTDSVENSAEIGTLNPIGYPELAILETNKPKFFIGAEQKKISPQELIALQSVFFDENVQHQIRNAPKKWAIGGQFAPAYSYREMKNNQSNLSSDYYNSIEKALLTFSGGLSINLEISNRFVMESGINYSQLGQSSNMLYAQANPNQSRAYEVLTSAGVIIPKPTSIGQISGGYSYVDALGNIINPNAEIIQNFSYLEIPFNARFKLIDKKLDFWVVGGVNTDVLLGNKVFFKEDNNKMFIGETENLNNFRYSTNLRISFDYEISSKLNFNFEPGFKYSLTPINKNPEIDNYPYAFGISTGFVYKF